MNAWNTASFSTRSTKKQNGGATRRKAKHLNDGAVAFEPERSDKEQCALATALWTFWAER